MPWIVFCLEGSTACGDLGIELSCPCGVTSNCFFGIMMRDPSAASHRTGEFRKKTMLNDMIGRDLVHPFAPSRTSCCRHKQACVVVAYWLLVAAARSAFGVSMDGVGGAQSKALEIMSYRNMELSTASLDDSGYAFLLDDALQ